MIITYIRSSSYAQHSMCPHSYFLSYVLGERTPSGKKATKGNVTHKALEMLARVKKAQQEGQQFAYEDEQLGVIPFDRATPEWCSKLAFDYYVKDCDHHSWCKRDMTDCVVWTQKALDINKGMFDPRNHNIVEAEQKFDFVIDKPWADYRYDLGDGEIVEGKLGLKGTMDLVVHDRPGLVEIIDWKTGKRTDWAKREDNVKTYNDLRCDPQLSLYHYAACNLFPWAEEIFMTIVYINDGGPFTLCFDRSDLELTEEIVRTKFETIRDTTRPELVRTWKCTKFCYFGMNRSPHDPSKTICQFFADKVKKDGVAKVTKEYGKPNAFREYGDGGGRKANND